VPGERDSQLDVRDGDHRPSGGPIRSPRAQAVLPDLADLSPADVMLLQRAVGNRSVRSLLRAPRRTSSLFHLSPQALSAATVWPSKYVWHQQSLRTLVEDTSTDVDAIATLVNAMTDAPQAEAIADLEQGLDDFEDTVTGGIGQLRDIRRNPAPQPDVAQMDDDAVVDHLTYLGDIKRRIEQVLMSSYGSTARDVAPGVLAPLGGWKKSTEPAALTAGTHKPTADERRTVRDVSAPAVAVDPVTKKKAEFEKTIAGFSDDYGTRVRTFLTKTIDSLHKDLVDNKGAADRGSVIAWDRYEDMAHAAQKVVDATFGAYARRPAMKHDVNLIDLWESRGKEQAHMTHAQRVEEAAGLLQYLVRSEGGVRAINAQHHADPTRTAEKRILNGVVAELSKSRTKDLQEINRGWEGEQDPATHRIFMQRWPNDPDADTEHITQRTAFWDTFEIFMHEYLHSLTSDDYEAFAQTLSAEQENTFTEGMTSFMTEIAFANIDPKEPSLRELIEGPVFSKLAFDPKTVPDVSNRRYDSYQQARRIAETVGVHNVFAAYFRGHVELIRPAK
jgi:hypothetical protein